MNSRLVYSIIVVFCTLFFACSRQDLNEEITQYTDTSHITGIAKYNGVLFCATKGGLVEWDIPSKEYIVHTTAEGLPSNILTDVIVDNENRLWVSSLEGLGMFNGDSWKTFGLSQGLNSLEVNDLSVDRSGKLWIGTVKGVASYENGKFKILEDADGPGEKEINCVYFDRGNNIWIATNNNGIYFNMEDVWHNTTKRNGLTGNTSQVITQSWDFRMWSASWSGMMAWDGTGWITYFSYDTMGTVLARYIVASKERLWFFYR